MELTVTVFPVPTFLLLNDDKFELVKVSDPINPESDIVEVAVLFPSYVLLEALIDETVSEFFRNMSRSCLTWTNRIVRC